MPIAQVNGTEIYYEIHGEGPPVLLIPGLGQGTGYYAYAIDHLSRFARCIALELRGVGRSATPRDGYSMEVWADDVIGLLDQLGVAQAHVVGSSLGGCVTMAMVARAPERIASMALIAAFSELDYALELNFRFRQEIVSRAGVVGLLQDHITLWTLSHRFLNTEHGQSVSDHMRAGIGRNDPEIYQQFLDAILRFGRKQPGQEGEKTYTELLRDVRLPTLLVVGADDIMTPPHYSYRIRDAMPAGVATVEVMENCGHVTFVEAPEENARLVTEFIKRVSQSATPEGNRPAAAALGAVPAAG